MCGITGIINFSQPVDQNLLKRMTDVLIHRGPDEEGFYLNKSGCVGFGFRRLSIIDLQGGSQPMANEDQTIHLIFNGEIYNYRQLREELKKSGHRFKTDSDTECIIHGYEEYGEGIFSLLNGMFAIAIWDGIKDKLILARDRCGEKPLHYFVNNDIFIFASEIKSILLHPAVQRRIDWEGFEEYFTFGFVSAPNSIYKGIKKVLPGNFLVLFNGRITEKTYWILDPTSKFSGDYKEAQEECLRLFEEVVKIRMYSDVPLGGFLSGGIDSSAIIAMMSRHSSAVNTFSIGFKERGFDERQYAKMTANRCRTTHEEFVVTLDYRKYFEEILLNFDEPFGDPSAIPTYMLAKLARKHVTVALSGDGGDELFGGYNTYQYMIRQKRKVDRFPKFFRKVLGSILSIVPAKSYIGKRLWILANNEPQRFIDIVTVFNSSGKSELFNCDIKKKLNTDFRGSLYKRLVYFNEKIDFAKQMQLSDFKHYLADDILVKVDRTTMMTSLESRAPFLDHRLIEFVFSLPSEWKVNLIDTKKILKDIVRKFLPKEILERKKMGFGVPLRAWFSDKLIDYYQEELLSPQINHFFNRETIQNYLKEHKKNKIDRSYEIWLILTFVLWAKKNNFLNRIL